MDTDILIELIWCRRRPPPGIRVRNETLADDEVTTAGPLPVTTPARTAFDLARHLRRGPALARLDALMRATPFAVEDVLLLAKRYPRGPTAASTCATSTGAAGCRSWAGSMSG